MRFAVCVVVLGLALCAAAVPAEDHALAPNSLEAVFADLSSDAAAPLPVCLFIHGHGRAVPAEGLRDDLPEYWGGTKAAVSKFCTPKFLDYYSALSGPSKVNLCRFVASSKARIVFAHGTANIAIAEGIQTNQAGCTNFQPYFAGSLIKSSRIPAGKVAWVTLQAPFGGSPAAEFCVKLCKFPADFGRDESKDTATVKQSTWEGLKSLYAAKDPITKQILQIRTRCGCPNGKPLPGVMSEVAMSGKPRGTWNGLGNTALTYAWAASCSASTPVFTATAEKDKAQLPVPISGIRVIEEVGLDGKVLINPPTIITGTDGFVHSKSCNSGRNTKDWKTDPNSRLFFGMFSHPEGAGRDPKALQFIAAMAKDIASKVQ